jgi:dTDP-4-amino-4,6-dideoxygalactose transaminase
MVLALAGALRSTVAAGKKGDDGMMRAIARYGVRTIPGDEKEIIAAFRRGEAVEGPTIRQFERNFAQFHSMKYAISASFGRMAFYYILKSLELPAGSEIIFPALTFWVVPEMARRAGLRPVFVDVDPRTFNLDPQRIEAALSERTRAIVPTHLYGQPCDMDRIMRIARQHQLIVIEDCAQAAGARYRGRRVGTFGDAAFFSFQMLKGINTYGGGMAVTDDATLAAKVRALAGAEPRQSVAELIKRFAGGIAARSLVSPKGFAWWGFPLGAALSFTSDADLSQYFWEKIRPLERFPGAYRRRFSNVQAILGMRALNKLDEFNERSQSHADIYTRGLSDCGVIETPHIIEDAEHVYYQYSVYVSDPNLAKRRAIRRGVDFETTHVDVCSSLKLFQEFAAQCPGAEQTRAALQLPVYSRLRASDVQRVLQVVKEVAADLTPFSRPIGAEADVRQTP